MRSIRINVLSLLLLFAVPGWTQPPQSSGLPPMPPNIQRPTSPSKAIWTPHPIQDPRAVQVVQASISAMGGAATIGQIQTWIVQGQVQPAPGGPLPGGSMTWEVSGAESKTSFTGGQTTVVQASGHGQPFRVENGTSHSILPHMQRASFFPMLVATMLLKELQDANYSIEYKGTATVGSEPVTIIRTTSQASVSDTWVTPQDWYFSNNTNLPVQVEHRFPDPQRMARFGTGIEQLSGYQPISGVLCPTQVSLSTGGIPIYVVTVSSVIPNTPIPSTEFDPVTGGAQ
jgi:hypothetical protein